MHTVVYCRLCHRYCDRKKNSQKSEESAQRNFKFVENYKLFLRLQSTRDKVNGGYIFESINLNELLI